MKEFLNVMFQGKYLKLDFFYTFKQLLGKGLMICKEVC